MKKEIILQYDGFNSYPEAIEIFGTLEDKKYKISIPWLQFKYLCPPEKDLDELVKNKENLK